MFIQKAQGSQNVVDCKESKEIKKQGDQPSLNNKGNQNGEVITYTS
jgi:hypothetical protein